MQLKMKTKLKFKTINEIFPWDLLLLVFAPMLFGSFINLNLLDARYIIINLVWLSFFTIPAALFKRMIFFRLAAVVFFIMGFMEIVHWIMIKGPVTITSIMVFLNTHGQEALEFLSLKKSWSFLFLIPYVYLFIFSVKKSRYFVQYKRKKIVLVSLFFISLFFVVENAVNGRLARKGIPQLPKVIVSFIDQLPHYKQINQTREPRDITITRTSKIQEQTIVIILGESLNRNHMSLYGYHRSTTPRLDSRGDILVFTDVVSPYSNTINSLLSMLSESNLQNDISYSKSYDVFDVFSSAGFTTYWISNQPPLGIWENQVTLLARKSDHVKFVNLSSNTSMEATRTISFDEKILDPFREVLYQDDPKKFIILHLMGSHSSYKRRYPKKYDVFKGNGKKENMIAQYDNSVLYNDFVVDSLLEISLAYTLFYPDHLMSIIYIADHGENVFDELNKVGHDFSDYLPRSNVEVPLVLWLSKGYKEGYPGKRVQAKLNMDQPYVADDLFHAIQDIAIVESEAFEDARSIFHVHYDNTRKRILVDDKNHDQKSYISID